MDNRIFRVGRKLKGRRTGQTGQQCTGLDSKQIRNKVTRHLKVLGRVTCKSVLDVRHQRLYVAIRVSEGGGLRNYPLVAGSNCDGTGHRTYKVFNKKFSFKFWKF